MAYIIPSAEPFLFPGTQKTGCLLVHGFTGTPKEMRWLGEYLNKRGYPVLGVRLTGHATRVTDMVRSRYQDWQASVEDGYHLLRGLSDQVVVIGLSMGGLLALLFGAEFPVAGIVAMSTPAYLPPDPRLNRLNWRSLFTPLIPKEEPNGEDWFDDEAWRDHISYRYNPTRSILELERLLEKLPGALAQIDKPVLLIHSKNDHYVPHDSMPRIFDALTTPQKRMVWVEKSGHVITRDADRLKVFEAVAEFVRERDKTA